jgi:peptide-methionine (S)-S-oxide reductase
MSKQYKSATFAAGCFWGVEARFRDQDGVTDAEVGYTGGHKPNPTYHEVCADTTGHAEAVHLTYDPARVSYEDLLELFFDLHDPTTLNRQGPDIGSQYRSAIYYHDEAQQKAAEKLIETLNTNQRFAHPVITEVAPATTFYRAEEYHQRYFDKTGRHGSCYSQ